MAGPSAAAARDAALAAIKLNLSAAQGKNGPAETIPAELAPANEQESGSVAPIITPPRTREEIIDRNEATLRTERRAERRAAIIQGLDAQDLSEIFAEVELAVDEPPEFTPREKTAEQRSMEVCVRTNYRAAQKEWQAGNTRAALYWVESAFKCLAECDYSFNEWDYVRADQEDGTLMVDFAKLEELQMMHQELIHYNCPLPDGNNGNPDLVVVYDYMLQNLPAAIRKLPIEQQAEIISVLLALGRQEGVWNPNADSGNGAYGVFQITPGTAQDMIRIYELPLDASLDDASFIQMLKDPQVSALLAMYVYVDRMAKAEVWVAERADQIRQAGGDPAYLPSVQDITLACYNAGPRKAKTALTSLKKGQTYMASIGETVAHRSGTNGYYDVYTDLYSSRITADLYAIDDRQATEQPLIASTFNQGRAICGEH